MSWIFDGNNVDTTAVLATAERCLHSVKALSALPVSRLGVHKKLEEDSSVVWLQLAKTISWTIQCAQQQKLGEGGGMGITTNACYYNIFLHK